MSPHNRSVAVLFALNSTEQMFVLDVLLDHVLFISKRIETPVCTLLQLTISGRNMSQFRRCSLVNSTLPQNHTKEPSILISSGLDLYLTFLKTIAGCHNLSLFFQQPALIVSNIRYAVLFCLSPIGKLYAPHCCFIQNKFTLRANSVLKLLS